MYAIVKTGGKQYKVEPGTVVSIEKLNAEVGDEVELPVIFVADGDTIEADPEKAAATKVTAEVLDQYKGKKQLVFKFKKRKRYHRTKGHRQNLTKLQVVEIPA
jgi:large subunit ribosomal protein L21